LAETKPTPYTTELDGIRAPLGVILYLIRRDNLDIYDIPIAKITKEYLDYLNMMDDMEIEMAGEFFVLAATLMRIKAQMLLRRDDETDEDPRDGLVRSLLEYKKMVEAANTMREMEEARLKIYTRRVPDFEKQHREEPTIELGLYQLMKAFQQVMVEFEAQDVREVELEEYTIEEKIELVEARLAEKEQVLFTELFVGAASRMELIVTLMAMLELIKHAHIKVRQDASFGAIWIYPGEHLGEDMTTVGDWDYAPEEILETSMDFAEASGDAPVPESAASDEAQVELAANESVEDNEDKEDNDGNAEAVNLEKADYGKE